MPPAPPSNRVVPLPLFYQQPVALDRNAHATACVPPQADFAFTGRTNCVPLMLGEFAEAARHYPILFTPGPESMPVALVGLHENRNLYLEPAGTDGIVKWRANTYVPAYIRRYPFILLDTGKTNQYLLCVDGAALVGAETANSQPLFTPEGALSPAGRNAEAFCQAYQEEIERTRAFTNALIEHNLLQEHHATVTLDGAEPYTLSGFLVIDVARLNQLPDAVFLDWRQRGWLPAIYQHLAAALSWREIIALASRSAA